MSTLIEHLRAGALYEEYGDVKEAVEELERQAKEIEELKADAARMEHLVSWVKCRSADRGGWHTWGFNFGQGWKTGGSFREAIDQSMKETP